LIDANDYKSRPDCVYLLFQLFRQLWMTWDFQLGQQPVSVDTLATTNVL